MMIVDTSLGDFSESRKGFFVPEYLYKGNSVIKVVGFVYSSLARKYWDVAFYGILEARGGMSEEYVIGHLEIEKASGRLDECNIRYTRFRDKRYILMFKSILERSV